MSWGCAKGIMMPWGGTGAIRVPWGGTGGYEDALGWHRGVSGCPGVVQGSTRAFWDGMGAIRVSWGSAGGYHNALGWQGRYQGVLGQHSGGPAVPMGVCGVVHQAHDLIHLDLAIGCGIAVTLVVAEDAVLQRAPAPAELCVAQNGAGQPQKHPPTHPGPPPQYPFSACPRGGMLFLPAVFSTPWGGGEGVWYHL